MKIMIDPGHGGKDPGAIGKSGLKEKDVTLKISNKVKQYLEHNSFEVLLTRNRDIALGETISQDLNNRCVIANNAKADYFVSIHCNSAANKTANGIETYAIAPGGNAERLANAVQKRLVSETALVNRRVKFANFAVLRVTQMPAILIEVGFISNLREEQLLTDDAFIVKVANAIAGGICDFLGREYKTVKSFDKTVVRYNGHVVDFFGLGVKTIDGHNYVPVRFLSEALGKKVTWNGEMNCVDIVD